MSTYRAAPEPADASPRARSGPAKTRTNRPSDHRSRAPGGRQGRARAEARILGAAVELFAVKGFDGTRFTDIAAQSGLPKANVYYYFPTKERLYTALIDQVIAGWDRAFEHLVPDREPREAIEAYVRAKLEYSRNFSAESRFFANEVLGGARFLTARHRKHMQVVTGERARVVEEWIRQEKMAPVDPRHFFMMLWSATQFYADFEALAADTLGKRRLTRKDYAAAARTITQVVLDGCGRRR